MTLTKRIASLILIMLLSNSTFASVERVEVYYKVDTGTVRPGIASEKYFAKVDLNYIASELCSTEVKARAQKLVQRHRTDIPSSGAYVTAEDVELRTATLNCMFDSWEVIAGKQQVTWGQSDYFRVLDIVNPLDVRENLIAYMDDFEEARVPLVMLNLSKVLEEGDFQLLVIPEIRSTILPIYASEFDAFLIAPDKIHLNLPNDYTFNNTSIASRYRFFMGEWDVGLYGYYGWEHDPLPESQDLEKVSFTLYRKKLFGASLSKPFGSWVFRSDLALQPNYKSVSNSGISETEQLSMLVGFDYAFESLNFSIQYAQSRKQKSKNLENIGRLTEQSSASMSKSYFSGRLLVENNLILEKNLLGTGYFNKFEVVFQLVENINVSSGLINYFGAENSTLGKFKDNSRLFLKLDYIF